MRFGKRTNHKDIAKRYKSFNFLAFRFSLNSGFTLIEIIISIAIIAVLASIGLVSFTKSRNIRQMTATGQNLVSVLRLAQSKTLAGEGNSPWGVRLEPDKFILFKGTSFLYSTTTEIFSLPETVEIAEVSLNGSGQDVIFNRITGATSQYGSFDVRIKNSTNVFSVSIDQSGKTYQSGIATSSANTRIIDLRHRDFNLGWSIKNSTTLTLTFFDPPNPNTVVSVSMAVYFDSEKTFFNWSGSSTVGGQVQSLRIHTVFLSDANTTLSVDRDCRQNTKKLKIAIDSKDIATYNADCQTITVGPYGGTVSEP